MIGIGQRRFALWAWQAWRNAVVERYREQGRQCPLSTLLSELGRADPVTESIVTELLEAWLARIATGKCGVGRFRLL